MKDAEAHPRPSPSWASSSSLCSGAAHGSELGEMVRGPEAGQDGHFFLAINVAALEDAARFKTRVDAIVREIHASGRARGVERLYVPGELEVEPEALSRRNGIPLNAETLTGIAAAAQNAGAHAKALFYASPAGADSRK